MANPKQKQDIDSVISFLVVKKLVTPIIRTSAYKLKLVDSAGKVIKEPKTLKELESLTLLDKIVFKLKRLLGSKLLNLQSFLYLQTLNNDFYNNLIVRGSIQNKAEIQRIVKDVKKLSESNGHTFEEILKEILRENIDTISVEE